MDSLRVFIDHVVFEMIDVIRYRYDYDLLLDEEKLSILRSVTEKFFTKLNESLSCAATFIASNEMYEMINNMYANILAADELTAAADNEAYFEEEEEFANGMHPTQIRQRAESILGFELPDKTYCQYKGNNIVIYWSSIKKEQLLAVFDYIKNEFIERNI